MQFSLGNRTNITLSKIPWRSIDRHGILLQEQLSDRSYGETANQAEQRRNCNRQQGPFYTSGFFLYCETCGCARPVHQREQHYANCRDRSPTVCRQQFPKRVERRKIGKRTARHICHNHYWYYDFICRKSEYKCGEYYSVKPEQPCERIEKSGYTAQNR